jgi:hypothetical protein
LICELVQLFNPPYVAERSATTDLEARLAKLKPFGERLTSLLLMAFPLITAMRATSLKGF